MLTERIYIILIATALIVVPLMLAMRDESGAFVWSFDLCLFLWLYKNHVGRHG